MAKKSATKRKGTKNITKDELKDLVFKGKQQGFLTYNEIQNVLPEEMLSLGQIDETLIMFDNHDIEIVDENKYKIANSIKKIKEKKVELIMFLSLILVLLQILLRCIYERWVW